MKNLKSFFLILLIALICSASTDKKPKILIIGDSISLGYTPHVAELLSDMAMVVHNNGNAQHSGTGLQKVVEWIGDEQWDIIQFNWGLWDLAYRNPEVKNVGNRDKVNGVVTFTPEQYQANLDSLVQLMQSVSKAQLLFVTTSYVPEGEAGRFVKDGPIYNRVALEVMKKYEIPVTDLYPYSKQIHPRYSTGSDNVHYTRIGSRLLAKEIIRGLSRFNKKFLKALDYNTILAHPQQNNKGLLLPEAIEEAKLLRSFDPSKPIEIRVQPGSHYLAKPIVITPDLSGIQIRGSEAGKVFIKGSKRYKVRWQHDEHLLVDTLIRMDTIHQFYVDGRKQMVARYPNFNEDGGHWQGHAADAIDRDRIAHWQDPAGGFVHAMHGAEWGDFHYRIDGMNDDGSLALTGGHQNNRPNRMHARYRMVENVFEELDAPSEFYFDTNTQILKWYPDQEGIPEVQFIEIPINKSLIELRGDLSDPVSNVTISNLTFTQTKRTFMEHYEPLLRSDWTIYRGGALFLSNTNDCHIVECELFDLGGNGIFVSGYNHRTSITKNHIHDIGASGISFVGLPSAVRSPAFQYGEFVPVAKMDTIRGPKDEAYPAYCWAFNNLIYRVGRIEKQVAGVQIAMSMGIHVHLNSIYDVPRAGINIGDGTWGGHIISNNDVFKTVQESGDHGSFNSWGRDRFWHPNRSVMDSLTQANPQMPYWDAQFPTIIRYNRFRCDHGWDIDLDDGSSNYIITRNLCLNGGIKLREGFNRKVLNNIMVNNGFHPHVWFPESLDEFKHNIVMTDHKDIRLAGWGKEVDYNLFPSDEALAKAQEDGTDLNSIAGNPEFLNPEEGNFNVSKQSPAHHIGFENFSVFVGVQYKPLKKIRQEPEIPSLFISDFQKVQSKEQEWLGATVKNIETLAERSASGLPDESGVLILSVKPNSPAAQAKLKSGDVIIECENTKITTMDDLRQTHSGHNWKGRLNLTLFRNQEKHTITIQTK